MMKRILILMVIACSFSSIAFAESGLVSLRSNHSVHETGNRLESILKEKGMKVVGRIDHSAGDASVDLDLRPTELFIFGNPKVGTPLMQCEQAVTIDLQQKMLIWEDELGVVWLTYNDFGYLAERHDIQGCEANIQKIREALYGFARAVAAR
jgi:uncharacterized protein (DUF302 family)